MGAISMALRYLSYMCFAIPSVSLEITVHAIAQVRLFYFNFYCCNFVQNCKVINKNTVL